MGSFFRKKRLVTILVSIIVLVVLIGYSIRDRDNPSFLEQFLSDTIGVVQSLVHAPFQYVSNIYTNIEDIKKTYEQNKVLKENLSEYKDLLYQVQALEKENKELSDILDKEKSIRDYKPIHASVIVRSPERWFQQITINKGKQHGVMPNMAVITAEGMIGKVKTSNQFTATVQLLSGFDINNRISVIVQSDEKIYGLIEGYDSESEALLLKITAQTDLEEGQTVVSSGLGGVFPEGLEIGSIENVEMDRFGLNKIAYVKPSAQFYEINHVMVVDRDMYSPSIDGAEGDEE
ncbi:rod shape-determining protein MreC [Salirhabdus salicampi]|uniref:rod shape-determining protein MreC n=1 Tax=Salirhabdus salicampi TaxID=476102 RepID=UPI0020C4E068|nr:rod shape-determining protein MreC [Salirhabdus salicampi]MCP8617012.1 rod shape-determining protein MreC [Salirhabdus salicampi]